MNSFIGKYKYNTMPNTHTKIYIHAVFGVKYKEALLKDNFRKELFSVIGNLINELGCQNILVNGVEDHVHCFFILRPTISLSEVMKSVKAKSSKWINENHFLDGRFEWQRGYGGFSYSQSQFTNLYKYVQNQEEHHKKEDYKSEFYKILNSFKVDYDEEYWFEDLK